MKNPSSSLIITEIKDNQIEELKKFHKSYFDVGNIQNTASELKYVSELKNLINMELQNPSEGFVRHFAKQVHQGILTAKLVEQFTSLIKKSFQQYINDLITERLKSALQKESEDEQKAAETTVMPNTIESPSSKIETTEEEKEAFLVVKTILRQKIKYDRIVARDAQSYFAILLDDNNRKTICRLYFNGNKKYIGTFDELKKETKSELSTIDDIFNHAETLERTVFNFDKEKSTNN